MKLQTTYYNCFLRVTSYSTTPKWNRCPSLWSQKFISRSQGSMLVIAHIVSAKDQHDCTSESTRLVAAGLSDKYISRKMSRLCIHAFISGYSNTKSFLNTYGAQYQMLQGIWEQSGKKHKMQYGWQETLQSDIKYF